MKYLILSSYPKSGSRNSGDDLLRKSLADILKHIKGNQIQIDFISMVDQTPNDIENFSKYDAILGVIRPTITGNNIAPINRNLFLEKALKFGVPIFAVGSGWKTYPGTIKQSNKLKLDCSEQKLFEELFKSKNLIKTGAISSRDVTTENLLKKNGISNYGTTGDPGLFDPGLIGTNIVIPKKVKQLAVSMPHNPHHKKFAYRIAVQLKELLNCEVSIVFHGFMNSFEEEMHSDWDKKQINFVDLSGGAEKLFFYENIDFHVGFRLHAHIWFLRTRKPSLLLGEDGRGMGHLNTFDGLGYSASTKLSLMAAAIFPRWQKNPIFKLARRKNPENKINQMIVNEIYNDYPKTRQTLKMIDHLWIQKVIPLFNLIP